MLTKQELDIIKMALSYAFSNLDDFNEVLETGISEAEMIQVMEKTKSHIQIVN